MDSAGVGHDSTGELVRLVPVFAASTFATLSPAEKTLLDALTRVGGAQVLTTNGVNAYPAPGTAATPAPWTSTYPHVNADR